MLSNWWTAPLLLVNSCVLAPAPPPSDLQFSVRPGPFSVERSLSELDTLRVGDHPKSVNVSPSQQTAYVCNLEQGSVDIFNTNSGHRIYRLRFQRTPTEIASHGQVTPSFEEKPVETGFTHNGRYVWISLLNSGGVVVYDTQNAPLPATIPTKTVDVLNERNRVLKKLRLRFIATGRQPKIIAPWPGHNKLFVANWLGSSVTLIDADTFKKIKNVEVGYLPRGICFTDSSAFVANFGSHTLSEIDLKTFSVKRTLNHVGLNPRHLVTSPNGRSLYLSNHGDAFIREIDSVSGVVLRNVHVGKEPRTIALSKNRNFLFVANYGDDTLAVIDLRSMTQIALMKTVRRPIGVSVDMRSDTVWVSGYWDRAVRRYRFDSKLNALKKIA